MHFLPVLVSVTSPLKQTSACSFFSLRDSVLVVKSLRLGPVVLTVVDVTIGVAVSFVSTPCEGLIVGSVGLCLSSWELLISRGCIPVHNSNSLIPRGINPSFA